MAQLYDSSQPLLDSAHLQRYLPPELAAAMLNSADQADSLRSYQLEAFIHLAAARYTVTTYLPRLVVQHLLHERFESPWLQRVDGSLLFADLSGSTALAERLSALGREGTERVTEFLNDIFSTMIGVIETFGGDLIAFGGDALLVFFGDDRHPRTAARTAMALQDALRGYERAVPAIGRFPMHLHIGIESGPVLFASAGLPHARHCCVLGATVNAVAAAEGHAGPGAVVAGPRAAAALASFATGSEAAPGFLRLETIRPPRHPHQALAEEVPASMVPTEAIPVLLDELSRISAYVPPVVLERILADPQLPQIEADLRPVSVLFAQVVGLEASIEALPPDQAALVLQRYVADMQEAIELFGGVVNKLDVADEGLKLVAIFGAPTAYEDHAERAALAALDMQERFTLMVDEGRWTDSSLSSPVPRPPSGVALEQRIGLNLGTVFAGNVGRPSRKEYTVMGDAVNVAARVMSKAAWGEVWCSAALAEGVTTRMICAARGAVALKGKAQPVPLFRVSERRDSAVDDLLPAHSPLIGRAPELAWLREHLAAAKAGAGRAVRIVGEAGVGKSRLTAALVEDARAAGFRILPAACFSYTSGIPYTAWAELLKALCGIVSGDSNAQRIRKLGAQLEQLGPGMEEWLPVLSDLARLDVAENRLTRGLDPKMRQTRRFELIEQLLLQVASETPVLALFEDLHWADSISLELWQRVAAALDGHPVLLVGIERTGLDLAPQQTHMLHLHELSAAESGIMIAALAGAAALPDATLQQIITRAEGNPLFLNELLRAVVERQATFDDLPDSLNGLLLARIDRLDEASRAILRVASVIGQRIPFGVLRSLQPGEQDALVRQLVRLDESDMTVMERIEPERVHVFRHALIQEVAYQSMLYARRRDLHGRIGSYLERRYAGELDDYVGLIAHHYRLSDRREKAITYLLKAGDAASAVYANEEAIQHYLWAVAALGDSADARTWAARDALGEVYATIGRYDDALAQHAAILAAPDLAADAAQRVHRKRGSVLEKQGQYAAALEELAQALALARSGDALIAPLAIPLISAEVALVYKRQGEYDRAIAACEDGLNGLRRDPRTQEDEQIEARLHSELGGIYGMRGDYPHARQHFEHSLHIRELIDDLPGLTAAHNNLGYLWQLQSEYEKAIAHYKTAEEVARKINLRFMIVFAIGNSAYAYMCLGNYKQATDSCNEVLILARELSIQNSIAQAHDMLGLVAFYQGDYDIAIKEHQEALIMHNRLGSSPQLGSVLVHLSAVMNAIESYEQAKIYISEALLLAQALDSARLKAEALIAYAESEYLLGQIDLAYDRIEEIKSLISAIDSRSIVGAAYRLQGQIESGMKRTFHDFFSKSLEAFHEIKDDFEIGRTEAAYGLALITTGEEVQGQMYLKRAQNTFSKLGALGEIRHIASLITRSI